MKTVLPLPHDEQLRLLESDGIADAVQKYLAGDPSRVGELFSMNREEYLRWALARPLREDGWLRMSEGTQDGIYLHQLPDGRWAVYQQERGGVLWSNEFSTYEEARRFYELEYGLGAHLK
jgi:hypothetical protein